MSIKEKLKSIRAAIYNIWFEHYFIFDPGQSIDEERENHAKS